MVAHGGPSGCSLPRVSACRDSLELGDRSFGSSTQRVPRRLCSSTDVFCRGLCSTIVLTIFIVWQLLTFGVFPMIFLCSLVFSPWGDTCLHGVPVHTIICLFIHEYIYTHYVNNISITRKFCMYDMICMVIVRSVTYGAMLEVSRGIWGKGCHVLWKMRSNILAICEGKVRFRDKGSETPWDPLKLQAIKHN